MGQLPDDTYINLQFKNMSEEEFIRCEPPRRLMAPYKRWMYEKKKRDAGKVVQPNHSTIDYRSMNFSTMSDEELSNNRPPVSDRVSYDRYKYELRKREIKILPKVDYTTMSDEQLATSEPPQTDVDNHVRYLVEVNRRKRIDILVERKAIAFNQMNFRSMTDEELERNRPLGSDRGNYQRHRSEVLRRQEMKK